MTIDQKYAKIAAYDNAASEAMAKSLKAKTPAAALKWLAKYNRYACKSDEISRMPVTEG